MGVKAIKIESGVYGTRRIATTTDGSGVLIRPLDTLEPFAYLLMRESG